PPRDGATDRSARGRGRARRARGARSGEAREPRARRRQALRVQARQAVHAEVVADALRPRGAEAMKLYSPIRIPFRFDGLAYELAAAAETELPDPAAGYALQKYRA